MDKIKKIICLFLLSAFLLSGRAAASGFFYGEVKSVPDGDTIILKSGRIIRYIGVDTPEMNYGKGKPQRFAVYSRQLNKKITKGQRLKIVPGKHKKDRFGRYLGYVYLPDNTMVNLLILENGAGWYYFHRDNPGFFKIFLMTQKKAVKSSKGIWNYISEIQKPVIVNKRSRRFHSIECRKVKKNKKNTLKVQDAFFKGYSPSRLCIENIFEYGN